jgi:hypothetical protein
MLVSLSRKILGGGIALPWSSIDSRDGAGATTTWETPAGNKWFLKSPPGAWKMETPSPKELVGSEQSEQDNLAVPLETLPPEVEKEEEEDYPPRATAETGAWTISILCMGLGLIAACLIIPQADANRRLVYEREQLRLELMQVQKQTSVNQEFLSKMESDPQLTERLAQREMHAVEQGEAIVSMKNDIASGRNAPASADSMSPFTLVNVPPPAALAPYQPVAGVLTDLCLNPRSHIYILGLGMFFVAGGLVLGGPVKMKGPIEPDINSL